MTRQQAYADLAKGYWLSEEIIPDIAKSKQLPTAPRSKTPGLLVQPQKARHVDEENGFLPPEEALFLKPLTRSEIY